MMLAKVTFSKLNTGRAWLSRGEVRRIPKLVQIKTDFVLESWRKWEVIAFVAVSI